MASSREFSDDDSVTSDDPETGKSKTGNADRKTVSPETIIGNTDHCSTNDSVETILRAFDLPQLIPTFQSNYFLNFISATVVRWKL